MPIFHAYERSAKLVTEILYTINNNVYCSHTNTNTDTSSSNNNNQYYYNAELPWLSWGCR